MTESPRDDVQSWTESMRARDRIRAVAETLRKPRSVNWISEQADAAWSTTNEEFQDLVGQGQLRRVEAGESTRYQPDDTRLLFEEIRTLIEENTREELRSELAAITEGIEEWQATYDVETWEELEQSLADGDLASDELRERRDVIECWQQNESDRRLIKHALALYSDVEAAREQMMRPDRRWRDVSDLRDGTPCHPLPLFLPRFVEAGRGESGRMDARCDAALFSLLREGSGPLSDPVRTPEVVAARAAKPS